MRTQVNLPDDISFTRIQRIMHWVIGSGCAAVLFTGLPIYLVQFLFNPPVPPPFRFLYWGFPVFLWRTFHVYLALLVVFLVCAHSVWDTYRIRSSERIMKVSRADLGEAWNSVRSFLGLSRDESSQPTTKYDFFHKAFHWTLIALGAFLLISGLIEWDAVQIQGVPVFVWLDRINHTFMDGFMRTGHLVAAMLFAGMAALHVYFSILPQNRPLLRAMGFGSSRAHGGNLQQQVPED